MTILINGDVVDLDDPNLPNRIRAEVVLQRITSLEREQLMPRLTRETILRLAEQEAAQLGLTIEQLKVKNKGYRSLKAFDDQIALLRAEYVALTTTP